MSNLEKNKITNIFIKNLVDCFFAWFWKIRKGQNIDKINTIIDNLLVQNFSSLRIIFNNENEEMLFEEYNSILTKIKNAWKYRYTKFNISNI